MTSILEALAAFALSLLAAGAIAAGNLIWAAAAVTFAVSAVISYAVTQKRETRCRDGTADERASRSRSASRWR